MSLPFNNIFNTPFITRGIFFRNDFLTSGSLTQDTVSLVTNNTFYTDGDILTITAQGNLGVYTIGLSLSGSPITSGSFAIRAGVNGTAGLSVNFLSGSTGTGYTLFGAASSFNLFTGSVNAIANINSYIDKIQFQLNSPFPSGSALIDFIQFYSENIPLRYINNSASYALKKRVIPLDAPMREQQIIQVLGSESPVVDLDGVFISDLDFTAQNYRDKLISVWNEGTYQWLQTDFIGAKFILDNTTIDELPGIPSYYKWTGQFKQYSPISASGQNYNLS